jgi:tetratricopeptide (TPR) repeat protein
VSSPEGSAGSACSRSSLSRFSSATTLRLSPLGRDEAVNLANGFVRDKPLSSDAARVLVDLAGGNPLYLRELVAMARAQQLLVDGGGCYSLKEQAGIPVTLQALLAARLDALDPARKQVIQHASVLGDATGAQIAALGMPDAESLLDSLVGAGFFVRDGEGRYRAKDSLLREVAYEMLPRNVRGELHRRASEVVVRSEERARHLERAARYLDDDEEVRREAAEALVLTGEAFLHASRHLDAMRMLERAVALGAARPAILIELAQLQSMCGRADVALETLAQIEDDPDNPAVAVERDHTAAAAKMFTDPAWAVERLEDVAVRWHELGNTAKEAWGYANAGVARFYMSQIERSAVDLERALGLFEQTGDRNGAIASSSFLCLVKPADPRVPKWLADTLEFADESGDRSRQITTLATLAWRNFIRSLTGSAAAMEEAERSTRSLAELAEELGALDMAMQAWSLLAFMARQTGRLEEARRCVNATQRLRPESEQQATWLGWAASFSVTVASGAQGAAPPFPPEDSPDPVVSIAGLVVEAELALAGRLEEAISRIENRGGRVVEGSLADVAGVFYAIALVLAGRGEEALPRIERSMAAALALEAGPPARAAAALRAEVTGDLGGIGPVPISASSIEETLVLRAHAVCGDASAARALQDAAARLAMPGLLSGIPVVVTASPTGASSP